MMMIEVRSTRDDEYSECECCNWLVLEGKTASAGALLAAWVPVHRPVRAHSVHSNKRLIITP